MEIHYGSKLRLKVNFKVSASFENIPCSVAFDYTREEIGALPSE